MQSNLPKSLEFGQAPGDLDNLLSQADQRQSRTLEDYDDDSDEEDFRSKKKQKLNGKPMNAKALLLANAAKMQNNLMDAM